MKSILIMPCAIACLVFAAQRPASAVEILIGTASHGTANCQAALPVFDGKIRKRPLAIANEGSTTAFVTCDFETLPTLIGKVIIVNVRLHNASATARQVSCLLLDSFGTNVYSPSLSKTVQLAPQSHGELEWLATDDNDGNNYTTPSMSCALPPGVEIMGVALARWQNVGQ